MDQVDTHVILKLRLLFQIKDLCCHVLYMHLWALLEKKKVLIYNTTILYELT